jgi:hypothetical protein
MKSFWRYFFELLIIVIGITISFWFNNLRESRIEKKEEIRLLTTIKENLIADSLQLFAEKELYSKSGDYFKNLVDRPFSQGWDSLEMGLGYLQTYSSIPVTEVGYKELQGGGLKYISNRDLRENIIKHYSVKNWEWQENNEIDRDMVLNQIIPYVNQNAPFFERVKELENNPKSLNKLKLMMETDHFKNLVKMSNLFKNVHVRLYIKILKENRILLEGIEKDLSRLD